MKQQELGRSGVTVSALGLGGVEFGPEAGDDHPDVDRAVAVIEAAREQGIDWLDTSENYYDTRNEALIGEALAKISDDFKVATKVAPSPKISGGGSGFRPDQVHAACRASLRRLGRDHVDVYFLHWPDAADGVPLDDTWGAMAELVDAGLVRAVGMSNYDLDDIERCHSIRPVDAVQEGMSLVDHLDSRDLVARCGERGIGATIYEPLAGGVLGGKTLDEVRDVWAAWASSGFYKRLLAPGPAERSFAVVDGLRMLADRMGATVAQVAIAWVLCQPGVDSAIVGSRSGRHMQENAGAADLDLASIIDELEQLIPLGPSFG
jgi:aryl-alcohol dehydrogenase-like predicted oxidoreductase